VAKDPDVLTEYVRQRLARSIVKQYETPEGVLPLVTIDQQMEDLLRDKIQRSDYGSYLSLDPGLAQKILANIHQAFDKVAHLHAQPILLCSPLLRRHIRKFLDRFLPQVVVLSHNELTQQTKIQSLGTVTLTYAD